MKYNVGDEFVIRIGEKYKTNGIVGTRSETTNKPNCLYRVEGFNALTFDENDLDKLDLLDDDYINKHYGMFQDAAYQKGLEDAWEVAQKLALNKTDGGMSNEKMRDIFGFQAVYDIFKNHTASEALEKIREYEEKQKTKDEIKVGDEICRKDRADCKVVVTGINTDNSYDCINWQGTSYTFARDEVIRTGSHFPQIAEVLERMKETDNAQ